MLAYRATWRVRAIGAKGKTIIPHWPDRDQPVPPGDDRDEVWENVEEDDDDNPYVRHMVGVTCERLPELFHMVATGDLPAITETA